MSKIESAAKPPTVLNGRSNDAQQIEALLMSNGKLVNGEQTAAA